MRLPSSVCARGSTSACVGWSSHWQRSRAVCSSAMLIWTSGSRGWSSVENKKKGFLAVVCVFMRF